MYYTQKFLSFSLISSLGIIFCEGKFYPEYEEYYEGMDKNQQRAFKYYIRSWRQYNDKMKHIPKDKLATMDEYLDTSGRGTMVDDVLYDVLKVKYDRDKAMQKYSHPDDQEMYMAVRKYTPTLASSEISNWIHDINSRYRNILGINETSTRAVATKKSTVTDVGKSTKFSTRITIFPKGYNPFASIESDYTYEQTPRKRLTRRFPKRKIEPLPQDVETIKPIFTTQATSVCYNVTSGEDIDITGGVMMESLVKNYFKAHSLQYKDSYTNAFGFISCPTGSPQSQEKLMKEFHEMMKVPDLRLEQIFRTYENRSVYNDSYIEEYLRAMNFSTMWVSDLPQQLNSTYALAPHINGSLGLEQISKTNNDLHTELITSTMHSVTSEHRVPNQAEDNITPHQVENSPVKNELSENLQDLEEEQRKLENSIKSLMKEHERATTPHTGIDDEKILEPHPFVDDFGCPEENKLDDLILKENKSIEKEITTNKFYYDQDKILGESIFQHNDALEIPRIVDNLDFSLEEKLGTTTADLTRNNCIQQKPDISARKPDIHEQKPDILDKKPDILELKSNIPQQTPNILEKIPDIPEQKTVHGEITDIKKNTNTARLETSTGQSPCSLLDSVKVNQKNVVAGRACDKCNHTHQVYHRKYNRRHRKHHRPHKKRHHYGYKRQHYPPYPYAYNPYYPPPYPYHPQYYPPPPPPPPNFYHFTSEYPGDNQPDSIFTATPDNQFNLYMKLKNIFQPVDKVLKGKFQIVKLHYFSK